MSQDGKDEVVLMQEPTTVARVLCMEDDPETLALMGEELVDQGFAVSLASNGQEGFHSILHNCPDLIVCDINMPAMNGFEFLEKMTSMAPRFSDVPFIFLTALGQRESELKGRRLGADDYLTKPVDFEILGSIIRARLARRDGRRARLPQTDLSAREIEALVWSARGKTSGEIASILGLSKRTVDFHIDNARNKLGVATRIEAVVKAAAQGLIGRYDG